MSQIYFKDKNIQYGPYQWNVSGSIRRNEVRLDRIEGPVYDLPALRAARVKFPTRALRQKKMLVIDRDPVEGLCTMRNTWNGL